MTGKSVFEVRDEADAEWRRVEAYNIADAVEIAAELDQSDGGGEWMTGERAYLAKAADGKVVRFSVHIDWSPEFTAHEKADA